MQLAVLHGPNLNRLGERNPAKYGRATLDDVTSDVDATARRLDVTALHFQSNYEGALTEWVHERHHVWVEAEEIAQSESPRCSTHDRRSARSAWRGPGSNERRLLDGTRNQATRLLGYLREASLPAEMHNDIGANLERTIRSTDELADGYAGSPVAAAVRHVVDVAAFLSQLSQNLEHNGFGTRDEALMFIRRTDEAESRLMRQAEGTVRS